uniref:Uncharacterized protein n=1 Tax=Eptatretus burgeri TaxID=7764 RepID=A0A8C4QW82_EPTBU
MLQASTCCQHLGYNIVSKKMETVRDSWGSNGEAPNDACVICPGRLRGVKAIQPAILKRLSKKKQGHIPQGCPVSSSRYTVL